MNQKKKKIFQKAKPQKFQVKKNADSYKISKQQMIYLFSLFVAVFIAYLPALNKEFINYDDNLYITQNLYIANFSFSKIPAIFGNFYLAQYSPIPSVIYGIIHMIVGFQPYLYNFIAVVLHLITMLLVFKLIWSLCNNFRIAFVTTALFGIATMQVESVAWLAAVYKTCTYSIFFLLSLIIYVRYIKTNKNKYIVVSLLLFFISCFCKEQAVSLSLAIVAIDIFFARKLLSKKVIIEKIPFFLTSLVFGLVEIAATKSYHQEGIIITSYSVIDRIIYASYSLCVYIYKLFIPANLSLLYPYFPLKDIRLLYMVFPLLLLIITGLYVYAVRRKNKYIIFGGIFFLLNILFSLVTQIIAVRPTVMADRYVYLASIGIFFIVAKGADILIEKKLVKLPFFAVFFIVFFLVTADLTFSRTKMWKDSMSILNDAISKSQTVDFAYNNRGYLKNEKGDFKGAIEDFDKAIAINSTNVEAYNNRGLAKANMGNNPEAIVDYNKAIAIDPKYEKAYNNRGLAKANMGDNLKAIEDYNKAISINPNYAEAYCNRGIAKANMGDNPKALEDYNKAISINPNYAEAYNNKGTVMASDGNFQKAITNFNYAIEINPKYLIAYDNRSLARYSLKDFTGAIDDCENALKLDPSYKRAINLKAKAQQELQKISH